MCQKGPHHALNLCVAFLERPINCVMTVLLLTGYRYVQNNKTFAFVWFYHSIWSGNCVWIIIHTVFEAICFFPRYIGWEMVKLIFFSTNVSTLCTPEGADMWRQFLFSSFLKQARGCYLINTRAWIHQWIISWVLRPSSVTMEHIFWHAISPS